MEAKRAAFIECELEEKKTMIEAFTRLFKELLIPRRILEFMPTIDPLCKEDIITLEETSRSKAVEMMLEAMLSSDTPEIAINEFILGLKETGNDHVQEIFLGVEDARRDAEVDRRHYFAFIVHSLKYKLKDVITPSQVVDRLVEEGALDEEDREFILTKERNCSKEEACHHLFERLPRKSSKWALALFRALQNSGHQALLDKIYADADASTQLMRPEGAEAPQELPALRGEGAGRVPQGVMGAPPSRPQVAMDEDTDRAEHSAVGQAIPIELDNRTRDSNIMQENDMEESDTDNDTDSEHARGYQSCSDVDADEKQEREGTEKDRFGHYAGPVDISPRKFQEELAEPALEGKNTVVCAPTGSGKTRVALLIIKNHLESSPPDGPPRKVLFLARTVPLVHQQHRTLKKYLQDYKVFRCSGRDEHNRFLFKYIEQNDVFVLTPQILVNQLKEEKIQSLSTFSLMVFDECHHTRKGEPYNALMMMYLCSKMEFPSKPLPQVVGLTASMGVEKSEREDAAVESTMKLLSALDAHSLSTVVKYIEELKQLVPVPEERSVLLKDRANDPGKELIESAIQEIEKILLEKEDFKSLNLDAGTKKYVASLAGTEMFGGSDLITRGNRIHDKNSQAYGQWASMLKHAAKMVVTKNSKERKASRQLYDIAENLTVYNAALEVLDMVRVEDVLKTLEDKLGKFLAGDRTKKSKVEKQIVKQYEELKKGLEDLKNQSRGKVNPNLQVLAETLEDMMKEESRCIIFVRTRATCFALAHWLRNDVPDLAHAMATPLVGQGAREEEWGMELEKQDKIIEKFRSGEVKLLVATSVAEEGLDIPDCNLVVRYNHVGNEISTVQMRGRCRKEHGKSVLVAREKIHEKESLNVIRAEMMKKAAEKIRAMEPEQFKKGITEKQKEVVRQFRQEEYARQRKPVYRAATPFTFCCSKCKEFAVNGKEVIIVNNSHRIVLAPDFKERITEIPEDRSGRPFDGLRIIGRINCAHCDHPWGKLFKYGDQTFPALSIKAFITKEREDGETKCWKKWTLLPYALREITMEDLYRELHGGTAPPEPEPMESA